VRGQGDGYLDAYLIEDFLHQYSIS